MGTEVIYSFLLLFLHTLQIPQPRPLALEARFIGNMAFAISDGSVTVMTDFPYESGYSGYMTYDAAEIRSPTARTLALVTHRHRDHWDRPLFERTDWTVLGPDDVTAGLPADRILPAASRATFGPVHIEPRATPHANVGHYSYVVTWHGRRLYFSGDTEEAGDLFEAGDIDVAFLSPWFYRAALRSGRPLPAKQIVIYHQRAGESVAECRDGCRILRQGETMRF
jgi:hypothetical protein